MGTHRRAGSRARGARTGSDHDLVAAVRRGDDRAFEQLYERYQRRIAAYIYGMVNDYGRAEDITQEVFISALRRMRETERPIAFKPWIYEIAKNACIDQFRRSRRAEEVSFDADEGLGAVDYGAPRRRRAAPDAARRHQAAARPPLRRLRRPVGDPPPDPRPARARGPLLPRDRREAWASAARRSSRTLFRARRRLTEEYDELVSGERCHPHPDDHRRPPARAASAPATSAGSPATSRTASPAAARRASPAGPALLARPRATSSPPRSPPSCRSRCSLASVAARDESARHVDFVAQVSGPIATIVRAAWPRAGPRPPRPPPRWSWRGAGAGGHSPRSVPSDPPRRLAARVDRRSSRRLAQGRRRGAQTASRRRRRLPVATRPRSRPAAKLRSTDGGSTERSLRRHARRAPTAARRPATLHPANAPAKPSVGPASAAAASRRRPRRGRARPTVAGPSPAAELEAKAYGVNAAAGDRPPTRLRASSASCGEQARRPLARIRCCAWLIGGADAFLDVAHGHAPVLDRRGVPGRRTPTSSTRSSRRPTRSSRRACAPGRSARAMTIESAFQTLVTGLAVRYYRALTG